MGVEFSVPRKSLRASVRLALRVVELAGEGLVPVDGGFVVVRPKRLEPVLKRPASTIRRYMEYLEKVGAARRDSVVDGGRRFAVWLLDPGRVRELAAALDALGGGREKPRAGKPRTRGRGNRESVERLEAEVERLREKLREAEELAGAYKERAEELEKENERLKEEIRKLREMEENLAALEKSLDAERRAKNKYKRMAEKLRARISELEERLADISRVETELKRKVVLLEAENRSLKKKLEEAESRLRSLERENIQLKRQLGFIEYAEDIALRYRSVRLPGETYEEQDVAEEYFDVM